MTALEAARTGGLVAVDRVTLLLIDLDRLDDADLAGWALGLLSGSAPSLWKNLDATLVVHGADDPLIRPSAGAAPALQISGARSIVYQGMGHSLLVHACTGLAEELAAQAGLERAPAASEAE